MLKPTALSPAPTLDGGQLKLLRQLQAQLHGLPGRSVRQSIEDVSASPLGACQAGVAKDAKVPRDERLRHTRLLDQLRHRLALERHRLEEP